MRPARPIRARTSGVTGPRALPPSLAASRRFLWRPLVARYWRAAVACTLAALCVFLIARRSGRSGAIRAEAHAAAVDAAAAPWLHPGATPAREPWHTAGVTTLQCPSYSGPAWRASAFPTRATLCASETLVVTPAEQLPLPLGGDGGRVLLAALPLRAVRLTRGESPFAEAEAVNLRYLMLLEPDRLLFSFRTQAGLPTRGAAAYAGWEDPGSELRGHFVGHYLSATAAAHAATGDAGVTARLHAVLDGMLECQAMDGYLSAYPSSLLDRFESQQQVWAPYYTLHKLLQGLLDAHTHTGRADALAAAGRLARYIGARGAAVVASKGIEYWRECLHAEYGGIPDSLRQAATALDDPELESWAQLWDKPCFHGPLAAGGDTLAGLHANAHLPLGPAAAARYAATGERAFLAAAETLFTLINDTRAFATGGSSHGELWHGASELGALVGGPHEGGTHSAESCATHNALKLAAWLLRVAPAVRYADFIERATLNGIMGTLRGSDPGHYLYMFPMGAGVSKAAPSQWRRSGWSTPDSDFWCCTGTMIESFARLGESLYFEQAAQRRLYVMHFASSTAQWAAAGAVLTQRADAAAWTRPGRNASLRVELKLEPVAAGADDATAATAPRDATPKAALVVRVPAWAAGAGLSAALNGVPLAGKEGPVAGAFLTVRRAWRVGDTLTLTLPLGAALRGERIADVREPFRRLHALLYGPLVLAALTEGPRSLAAASAAPRDLAACAAPVPDAARAAMGALRGCAGGAGAGLLVAHELSGSNATKLSAAPAEVPGPAQRRKGGTDAHAAATWRLVSLGGDAVALEASHRPGAFLCAPEAGAANAAPLLQTAPADSGDPLAPTVPPCGRWKRAASAAPGGPRGALALESLARPGAFLRAAPGSALTLATGSAADADACFELDAALAELPPVAFWARGMPAGRRFLLLPLQDIVDETYSAYVELQD